MEAEGCWKAVSPETEGLLLTDHLFTPRHLGISSFSGLEMLMSD